MSLEAKNYDDLRVHFSDTEWKKLKEVEKIIYLNQKSNHLFKLSLGLKSKTPHFMKTDDDDEEDDQPSDEDEIKPRARGSRKKTYEANPDLLTSLRKRSSAVVYTEPKYKFIYERRPYRTKGQKPGSKKKKKRRKQEDSEDSEDSDDKNYKPQSYVYKAAASPSSKRLRNRTNVVSYKDPICENQGSPEVIKEEESEDEDEWIPSDEESVDCENHGAPDFTEDGPTIPAAADATGTAEKVCSSRVVLKRLSGDRLSNLVSK